MPEAIVDIGLSRESARDLDMGYSIPKAKGDP